MGGDFGQFPRCFIESVNKMRWRSGNKSLVPRYGLVLSALMNLESLGLLMGALNDRHVEHSA